jgi:hypothetical protein
MLRQLVLLDNVLSNRDLGLMKLVLQPAAAAAAAVAASMTVAAVLCLIKLTQC